MKYVFIFLCSLSASLTMAQKPFEGRIDFKVEYLHVPEDQEGVEQMLPQSSKWVVRGNETRVSQHVPFAGWQTFIYKPQVDTLYQQIELFDKNMLFAGKLSDQLTAYTFTERDATKVHLGITLHKGVLESEYGESLTVWYHKKYQNTAGSELVSLPYLPLIFEVKRKGITYQLTATSFREEPTDDTYFIYSNQAVRIQTQDLHKILK